MSEKKRHRIRVDYVQSYYVIVEHEDGDKAVDLVKVAIEEHPCADMETQIAAYGVIGEMFDDRSDAEEFDAIIECHETDPMGDVEIHYVGEVEEESK